MIAKKHATRIAHLFNSFTVAVEMIGKGYTRADWVVAGGEAAHALMTDYGIKPIGCDEMLAAYKARCAGNLAHTQAVRDAFDARQAAKPGPHDGVWVNGRCSSSR